MGNTWEDKHHCSEHPLLSSSPSPGFICWTWSHMIWNIPCIRWGHLSQLCPLPTLPPQPSHRWVEWEAEKHCSTIMRTSLFSTKIQNMTPDSYSEKKLIYHIRNKHVLHPLFHTIYLSSSDPTSSSTSSLTTWDWNVSGSYTKQSSICKGSGWLCTQ